MLFQKQLKSLISALLLFNLINAENADKKEQLTLTPGPITGKYNKNDLNETYGESSIEIKCQSNPCTSTSDKVLIEDGKVTLSNADTYIFGGELNGQLNITATKEDVIHLILRNATITSDFGPAIYAECKKLIITTEGYNTITDSENYPKDETAVEENETDEKVEKDKKGEKDEKDEKKKPKIPNACIYVDGNLSFNGKGTIEVNGNFKEGIRSKKNIKLVSGKMIIVSKGNAIKAKESISVKNPEIKIDAGASGIKATKDTDPEEGFVVIEGGKMIIKAVKDGVHAETHLTVSDGYIEVTDGEEGLEAQMIDITGGDISVNVENDGINAALIGSNGEDIIKELNTKDQKPSEEQKPSEDEKPSQAEAPTLPPDEENDEIEDVNNEVALEDEEDSDNEDVIVEGAENSENDDAIAEAVEDSENNEEDVNLEDATEVAPEVETEAEAEIENKASENKDENETPVPSETSATNDSNSSENLDIDTRFDDQVYIRITGGKVHVTVRGKDVQGFDSNVDAFDSNGSLYFGGDAEIYVNSNYGGIFGHFGAIDTMGTKILDKGITALLAATGKFYGMPGMPGSDSVPNTVEKILKVYPDYTVEEAEKLLAIILELEGSKAEENYIYDEPSLGKCLQPYVRVSFNIQKEGTPIKILDSKDNVLIEHSPLTLYAIILYTSPEIVEGETYTVIAGDVKETVVAQVDAA